MRNYLTEISSPAKYDLQSKTRAENFSQLHSCWALAVTSPEGERFSAAEEAARIYTRLYQDSCSYLCVPPPCYAVRIKDGCGASLLAIGVPVHSVHGEPKRGRGWSKVKVKRRSLFYKRACTRTARPEVRRTQISVLWYVVEFCCWIKSRKMMLISGLLKES